MDIIRLIMSTALSTFLVAVTLVPFFVGNDNYDVKAGIILATASMFSIIETVSKLFEPAQRTQKEAPNEE